MEHPCALGIFDAPQAQTFERFRTVGFIDCTILKTTRPGQWSKADGTRGDDDEQRAFYTWRKKVHGLKFQAVVMPDGMIADLSNPFSCKRNDLHFAAVTEISNRLRNVQRQVYEVPYYIYGDSAYSRQDTITAPFTEHDIERVQQQYGAAIAARAMRANRVMKSVRIAIEWVFGLTGNVFRSL